MLTAYRVEASPVTVYHISDPRNRQSIEEKGLQPDTFFPDPAHHYVWVFDDPEVAKKMASPPHKWAIQGSPDIWAAEVDRQDLSPDPHPGWKDQEIMSHSFVINGVVPPERIHRIARVISSSDASPMERVSAKVFADALEKMKSNSRAGYLTFYNAGQIQANGMIPILGNSGKTGVLIWDHGGNRIEAAALFNYSDVPGAGIQLLRQTLDQYGVTYVEAFEPLDSLYRSLGFYTVETQKFNDEYASPLWNPKDGRPNVHYMVRTGCLVKL